MDFMYDKSKFAAQDSIDAKIYLGNEKKLKHARKALKNWEKNTERCLRMPMNLSLWFRMAGSNS